MEVFGGVPAATDHIIDSSTLARETPGLFAVLRAVLRDVLRAVLLVELF